MQGTSSNLHGTASGPAAPIEVGFFISDYLLTRIGKAKRLRLSGAATMPLPVRSVIPAVADDEKATFMVRVVRVAIKPYSKGA